MNFKNYQRRAFETFIPSDSFEKNLCRMVLGLCGESGEVAEKIKKYLRGDFSFLSYLAKEPVEEISKELGDILWYISGLASLLNISLDKIATENIEKLYSRKKRGKIKGSGDNR